MTSVRQAKKKMDRWWRYYYRTTKPLVGFGCTPGDIRAWDQWNRARRARTLRKRQPNWPPRTAAGHIDVAAILALLPNEDPGDNPWGTAFESLSHLTETLKSDGLI